MEDELWLSPVNDEDGYRDGKEIWRHATKPVGKPSNGSRSTNPLLCNSICLLRFDPNHGLMQRRVGHLGTIPRGAGSLHPLSPSSTRRPMASERDEISSSTEALFHGISAQRLYVACSAASQHDPAIILR
jgi:hypothetical protein